MPTRIRRLPKNLPSRLASALAAAAAVCCVSCTTGRDVRGSGPLGEGLGNTLHLSIYRLATLNPLLDDYFPNLASLSYDTLVVADSANRLQPRLAEVVPTSANGGISADGRTIRFPLRRDVQWHDGQPFTSDDVAFTLARINDPAVNVPSRDGYDRIASVSTPDRFTVIIHLRERLAPAVSLPDTAGASDEEQSRLQP